MLPNFIIISSQALLSEVSSGFSSSATTPNSRREQTSGDAMLLDSHFYTPIEQIRTRRISGLQENEWGKSEKVCDEKIKEFIHLFLCRHPDCKFSFLSQHSKGLFPNFDHHFHSNPFRDLICSSPIDEESLEVETLIQPSPPPECTSQGTAVFQRRSSSNIVESLNHSTPFTDRILVPHTKRSGSSNSKHPRRRRGRTSSGENIDGAANSLWKVDRNQPNFLDYRSPKHSGLLSCGKKRDISFCFDDEYSAEYSFCSSSTSDTGSSCPSRCSSAFPFDTNSNIHRPGSAVRSSSIGTSPSIAIETLALSNQQQQQPPASNSISSPPQKKRSQSLYDERSKSVPLLFHFESVLDVDPDVDLVSPLSPPRPPCSLYLPPRKTRGRSASYTEDVVASLHSNLPYSDILPIPLSLGGMEPAQFAPILSVETTPPSLARPPSYPLTDNGHCLPSFAQGICSPENVLR
jgi:hypothetical protein